ncbi:MAG: RDD family protein [Marinifilaceae bacterium]
MESINVETTQNVKINYQVASVGERLLATILDFVFLAVVCLVLGFFLNMAGVTGIVMGVILVVLVGIYHIGFEVLSSGQSLGKLIMKLRVVRLDGGAPGFMNYFIRWIFRLIDITATTGLCAIITIVLNDKGQRLGDISAGTTVVRVRKDVSLSETIFQEITDDYEVIFPEAAKMSDRDIDLVQQVIQQIDRLREEPVEKLQFGLRARKKVTEQLAITTEMEPKEFFQTILKDYNHLYGR